MKKKQIFITLTAMALTAAMAIGGTLAYLSTVTETKKNVFTSSGLGGYIVEDFDEDTASKYTPGDAIYKRPRIGLEESSKSNAYVAARIVCKYTDPAGVEKVISLEEFKNKYGKIYYTEDQATANGAVSDTSVEGIHPAWNKIQGINEDVYVYVDSVDKKLKELSAGNFTENIFDEVKVLTGIEEQVSTSYYSKTVYKETSEGVYEPIVVTEDNVSETEIYYSDIEGKKRVDVYELPKFEIDVQGFLVQSEGMEYEQGYIDALVDLVDAN